MMSFLSLILFFALSAFAIPAKSKSVLYDVHNARELFEEHVKKFDKVYGNESEFEKRLKIFEDNLKFINKLNKESDTAEYGINHFFDLTFEEVQERYMGFDSNFTSNNAVNYVPTGAAPENLDWRQKGIVTPVKQQGHCGSCYCFAAIGAIEGQYALRHGRLASLSEQQALDCDVPQRGCGGGFPHIVMSSLAQQGGSMADADYSYTHQKGQCHTDPGRIVARVAGGQELKVRDEEELKDALAKYGPLAIALDFSQTLAYYTGGVSIPQDCWSSANHAVLLVGYGVEAGTGYPYWIIKNSHGEEYGEQGYLRLVRGQRVCQIASYVAVATVN